MNEYEISRLTNQIKELNSQLNKQYVKSTMSDTTAMIISILSIVVIVGIALI